MKFVTGTWPGFSCVQLGHWTWPSLGEFFLRIRTIPFSLSNSHLRKSTLPWCAWLCHFWSSCPFSCRTCRMFWDVLHRCSCKSDSWVLFAVVLTLLLHLVRIPHSKWWRRTVLGMWWRWCGRRWQSVVSCQFSPVDLSTNFQCLICLTMFENCTMFAGHRTKSRSSWHKRNN